MFEDTNLYCGPETSASFPIKQKKKIMNTFQVVKTDNL